VDIIVDTDAFAGPELGCGRYGSVVDSGMEKADVGMAAKELVGRNPSDNESLEAIRVSVLVMKIVTGGSVKRIVGSASEYPCRVPSTMVVRYIVCPFSVRVWVTTSALGVRSMYDVIYTRDPDSTMVKVEVSGSGVLSMTDVTNRVLASRNSVYVIVSGSGVLSLTEMLYTVVPSRVSVRMDVSGSGVLVVIEVRTRVLPPCTSMEVTVIVVGACEMVVVLGMGLPSSVSV
jgi:hypothetical protein